MASIRLIALILLPLLAVEAAIYYSLVGLGAGEDLIVYVELIWLVIAAALGSAVFLRYDRGY